MKNSNKKPSFSLKKFSAKLTRYLLILLPPALFLSYHPVISLAETETMNLEFSIAEIWLILLFLASLPHLVSAVKFYGAKKLLLAAVVPAYFLLTAIWSKNHLRALLTAGLFSLIVYVTLYIIYILKTEPARKLKSSSSLLALMIKSMIISAVVASSFCWLQCLLDLAGIPRDYTLLCRGCISTTFGFPHPNGFAIEPQFMGNLLIAPILLCFYILSVAKYPHRKLLVATTIFLATTLFITFSRGAIYATIIGLIVQQITIRIHKKQTSFLKSTIIVLISFFLSLCAQGVFAAVGPTTDNFTAGVTKSLHQLTLGKLDLRSEEVKNTQSSQTDSFDANSDDSKTDTQNDSSSFDGYVPESTDIRLGLNSRAFKTWLSSPRYILLGTGLGAAGLAMHELAPEEIGPKEIVQNEYVSLLLETGIIGIAAIIIVAVVAIKSCQKKPSALFIGTLVAFLCSLLFFSGLPNAIHIYFFLVIIFLADTSENYPIVKQKV